MRWLIERWYWLLPLWPITGWIRMVICYRKFQADNGRQNYSTEFDWQSVVYAAVCPWFDPPK